MVLHFEEFCQTNETSGKYLSYYHKLPEELHLMETKVILTHINRFGSKKVWEQQNAVSKYFKWLHKTYNIDMSKKIYELEQNLKENNVEYIGFYNLNDLRQAIEEARMTLETSEHPKAHSDYDGLYAIFFLEWFGIPTKSISSIRLEDVTNMGRKVYIPVENRTVKITDEIVADYLWEYKNKKGSKKEGSKVMTPYKGDTYFRTTREVDNPDVERQIYNARSRFIQACGDTRFSKNNVYQSGRFYAMLAMEEKSLAEFKAGRLDEQSTEYNMIRTLFNAPDMPNSTVSNWIIKYYKYKKTYLSRL